MKKSLSFVLILILFVLTVGNINAQGVGSLGIATDTPFGDGVDVPDASIICVKDGSYDLCTDEYDSSIFGVSAEDAAIALEATGSANSHPVVTSGITVVRVDATNGNIAKGDNITSSATAGVGIKATRNGYILGNALEDYAPNDAATEGQILVSLNTHLTTNLTDSRANILESLRQGLSFAALSPLSSLRYLLAFAIVVLGFGFGLLYFGRVARAGIEAMGRNPLARRSIQAGILFNIVLGVVIVAAALAIGAFILIL